MERDAVTPRWWRVTPLHREMSLVAAALYLGGGGLVVAELLAGGPAYHARAVVVAVAVVALGAGAFYLWTARHLPLPLWAYVSGTSLGAVLVTAVVVAGGPERTATFGVLYVFVSTYGFFYYGPRVSSWIVLLDGVGFAGALAFHDVPAAVGQWAVIVGTSIIAGGLTGFLSQRFRRMLLAEQDTVRTLNELDGWRTTFLRAVAHDLRSPLAAMQGLLELLQTKEDQLTAEQRSLLLDRSVESGRRLQQLLDDLLDVQRIEAGVLQPDLESVALDDVVRRGVAGVDGVNGQVELDLDRVVAMVEPAKVDRIVVNLVRNAMEHTPSGTAMWIGLVAEDQHAVLTVEDDGPGVREAVRDGLFDAFRRDGAGLGDGVGLGLHLVQRFTDLHDGTVEVGDRPGGGASFTVRLPLGGPTSAGDGAPGR